MSKQTEAGKKFIAADSIDYAIDAVISKTILKKTHGNITLFSFDAGQELSEHSTPHDALVQVLDGSVEITIGGEPQLISTGESIILPANIPHALKAVTPFKMMLTMVKSGS